MLDKKEVTSAIARVASGELTKRFALLTEKTDTIAKMRLEFFDRIVLLNGGTVALSVTLIGSFASKSNHSVKCVLALIISWFAFLLSMIFALSRNWLEHDRLGKAETSDYLIALQRALTAEVNVVEALSVSGSDLEQLQKLIKEGDALSKTEQAKHQSLLGWTKLAGVASLVATLLGFILLLVFAIKNISSL